MADYLQLAQDVVRRAAARGVEAEAIVVDEQETLVRVDRGQVEQLSQAGSKGLGVRIIDGGRMGYAYTSDFSPEGIEDTWKAALDLAKVSTPDEYRTLPDPQPVPDEDLEIFDGELAQVPVEDKVAFAKTVEQAALDYDPRVAMTMRCTYQDAVVHFCLANSRGFAGSFDQTVVVGFLMGVGRDESGQTMSLGLDVSNHYAGLNAARRIGG